MLKAIDIKISKLIEKHAERIGSETPCREIERT